MGPLALFFALTALLYASVGFGGGSTYNALLVISGVDYRMLPLIALICNIIVVSGGCLRFYRAGSLDFALAWPWLILSIPAAWLGGRMAVSEQFFIGLLGLLLLISGAKMLWDSLRPPLTESPAKPRTPSRLIPLVGGAVLGLAAGITGIGGGIFLAPLLHMLAVTTPRRIAALCSLFILMNSLAGLLGQSSKLAATGGSLTDLAPYWMLFVGVLIGGQIGSYLGASKLTSSLIKKATAVLILYVSVRLLWRFLIVI